LHTPYTGLILYLHILTKKLTMASVKKGGEDIIPQTVHGEATDVNMGHHPAEAPRYELGGTNPRDMKKSMGEPSK
jgi:hypothetical protein